MDPRPRNLDGIFLSQSHFSTRNIYWNKGTEIKIEPVYVLWPRARSVRVFLLKGKRTTNILLSERLTWSVRLGESYTNRQTDDKQRVIRKAHLAPGLYNLNEICFDLSLTFPLGIYSGKGRLRSKVSSSTFYCHGARSVSLSESYKVMQTDDKQNVISKARLICQFW